MMRATGCRLRVTQGFFYWPLALTLFFSTNSCYYINLSSKRGDQALELLAALLPICVSTMVGSCRIEGRSAILKLLLVAAVVFLLMPKALVAGTIVGFVFRMVVMLGLYVLLAATMRVGGFFEVLVKFEKTTVVFASVSLFFWLFGEILHLIPPSGTIANDWSGGETISNYFYLHFGAQGQRNCGVFCEAPMYNLVLCSALFVELFVRASVCRVRLLILVATIASTMSTTGQLVTMGGLFVRFFILRKRKASAWSVMFWSIVSLASLVAVAYASKYIMEEKATGASYTVRAAYMLKELRAFASSPIVGHGFLTFTFGSSNSICPILAEGGLVQFALYTSAMLLLPYYGLHSRHRNHFCFFAFYFAAFSITICHYNPLTQFVMAMGLCRLFVSGRKYESLFLPKAVAITRP